MMILRIPSMTSSAFSLRLRPSLFWLHSRALNWRWSERETATSRGECGVAKRSSAILHDEEGWQTPKILDRWMYEAFKEAQNSFWKLNPADWIATLNSFAGETTRTHTRKKRRKWKMTHLLEKKSKMGLLQEEEPHQVPEELLCWN